MNIGWTVLIELKQYMNQLWGSHLGLIELKQYMKG